jgi:DnaJ-class molecular chaperone
MPSVSGHGRGALHVRLVVDVPKRLTKDQKKLIEQLGNSAPESRIEPRSLDGDGDRPFFEKVRNLFG